MAIVQTIPVGVTPNAIVFARGALWVTSADDRSLNKINPVSGHVVKRIRTGAVGRGVAVGDGAVLGHGRVEPQCHAHRSGERGKW